MSFYLVYVCLLQLAAIFASFDMPVDRIDSVCLPVAGSKSVTSGSNEKPATGPWTVLSVSIGGVFGASTMMCEREPKRSGSGCMMYCVEFWWMIPRYWDAFYYRK